LVLGRFLERKGVGEVGEEVLHDGIVFVHHFVDDFPVDCEADLGEELDDDVPVVGEGGGGVAGRDVLENLVFFEGNVVLGGDSLQNVSEGSAL
jgi:hypothetical protein